MTPQTVEVFYQGQPIDGPGDYMVAFEIAAYWARSGRGQFMDRKRKIRDLWACKSVHPEVVDQGKPSMGADNGTISASESFLNALSLIEPRMPAARAARAKVRAWPFVGDNKAVRVGPVALV